MRVAELDVQLRLVGQTILPLGTAFQIQELPPMMDALMAKIGSPGMLTEGSGAATRRGAGEPDERHGPLITESEHDVAAMPPMVTKRVKADIALLKTVALKPVSALLC